MSTSTKDERLKRYEWGDANSLQVHTVGTGATINLDEHLAKLVAETKPTKKATR